MDSSSSSSSAKRNIWLHNDKVIVSQSSRTLVPGTGVEFTVPKALVSPLMLKEPQLLSSGLFAHLPYCLIQLPTSGVLFSRLDSVLPGRRIPVRRVYATPSYWSVDSSFITGLDTLEAELERAYDALCSAHGLDSSLLERSLCPDWFSCSEPFKTKDAALRQCLRRLNAFRPLLARISYVIACITVDGYDAPASIAPLWERLLQAKVPPAWVQALKDSPVGDFSNPTARVGAYITPDFPVIEYRRLMALGVPCWFEWSLSCNAKLVEIGLDSLIPTDTELANLYTPAGPRPLTSSSSALSTSTFSDPPHPIGSPCVFPTEYIEPRWGLDVAGWPEELAIPDWFAHTVKYDLVSPNWQRGLGGRPEDDSWSRSGGSWLHSSTPPPITPPELDCPPTPSSEKHIDNPNSEDTKETLAPAPDPISKQIREETMEQFFLRRSDRHAKMKEMETLNENRRRLDRERTWGKLPAPCPGLGSKAPLVFEWQLEEDFLMRQHIAKRHVDSIWVAFSSEQKKYNSYDNEWDIYEGWGECPSDDEDEDRIQIRADLPRDHFWDLVLSRMAPQGVENAQDDIIVFEPLLPFLQFRFCLPFDFELPSTTPPSEREVGKALFNLGYPRSVLNATEQRFIVDFMQAKFNNSFSALDLQEERNSSTLLLSIWSKQGRSLYVLEERNPDNVVVPWVLATESATTAMECLRSEEPLYLPSAIIPFLPPQRDSPAFRPAYWKPTLDDYNIYVSQRDMLLRSYRGRAALQMGGIVWRLAVLSLGFDYQSVLLGPSPQASIFVEHEGRSYYDDFLTATELDIICGTYYVYTGVPRWPGQTIQFSWFPQESTWRKRYGSSYWTPSDEDWFLKHLSRISQNPSTAYRSASQWKTALTKSAKHTMIQSNVENHLASLLS